MVCLSCRAPAAPLCGPCRSTIRRGGDFRTPGGVVVRSWALHEGAARNIVRRLKYEGVAAVADVVASELVDRIPPGTESLVPIARTLVRRVRYGVDPASLLAQALSRRSGLPVHHALASPVWNHPNAGSSLADRRPPQLRRRFESPAPVLVDDVFTTGSTIDRAATTLGGVIAAVTVTGVP